MRQFFGVSRPVYMSAQLYYHLLVITAPTGGLLTIAFAACRAAGSRVEVHAVARGSRSWRCRWQAWHLG
jgi:hypothetical protein